MKPFEIKTYCMLWNELYEFVKDKSVMHEHDSLTTLTESCAYDKVKQKMEQLVKREQDHPASSTNVYDEAEWLLAPHESIPAKRFLCSNCRNEFETKHYTDKCYYNFCPNCGFKMR